MATEYLTKPDIDMILESLRYTKEAFQKYLPEVSGVYPSREFQQVRLGTSYDEEVVHVAEQRQRVREAI